MLSVDYVISNKLYVVHSNDVTETQKKPPVSAVLRMHIISADTKILVFVPCILFVRFLVFSEQTAIILLCSTERFFFCNADCECLQEVVSRFVNICYMKYVF